MLGRIFIILVALQLVVTSAFAHVMPMAEHCAEPAAQHVHSDEISVLQDQVVDTAFETEQQPKRDRQVVSRDRKWGCATFCHAAMLFAQSFQRSNAATRL